MLLKRKRIWVDSISSVSKKGIWRFFLHIIHPQTSPPWPPGLFDIPWWECFRWEVWPYHKLNIRWWMSPWIPHADISSSMFWFSVSISLCIANRLWCFAIIWYFSSGLILVSIAILYFFSTSFLHPMNPKTSGRYSNISFSRCPCLSFLISSFGVPSSPNIISMFIFLLWGHCLM